MVQSKPICHVSDNSRTSVGFVAGVDILSSLPTFVRRRGPWCFHFRKELLAQQPFLVSLQKDKNITWLEQYNPRNVHGINQNVPIGTLCGTCDVLMTLPEYFSVSRGFLYASLNEALSLDGPILVCSLTGIGAE